MTLDDEVDTVAVENGDPSLSELRLLTGWMRRVYGMVEDHKLPTGARRRELTLEPGG